MKVYSTPLTDSTYTLGVDPGSRKTGLALFKGEDLVWWTIAKIPTKLRGINAAVTMAATVRAIILERVEPEARVIIEAPGKQVRSHSGATLITLGAAVGAITYALTDPWTPVTVTVREWSPMGGPRPKKKEDRAVIVASMYPSYDPTTDRAMDAADAIGLVASAYNLVT